MAFLASIDESAGNVVLMRILPKLFIALVISGRASLCLYSYRRKEFSLGSDRVLVASSFSFRSLIFLVIFLTSTC